MTLCDFLKLHLAFDHHVKLLSFSVTKTWPFVILLLGLLQGKIVDSGNGIDNGLKTEPINEAKLCITHRTSETSGNPVRN